MSYRMTVKLQHPYYYTAALTKRDALTQRLHLGMGGAGQVLRISEQLDHVVVEYELAGDGQFDSHQSVVERVEWAAAQLAARAVEAEVVRLVEVSIYTGIIGGLGAFGVTAKAHPLVTLLATLGAGYGAYKVGQLMPQEVVILRATRHPYYGWMWAEVQPPQFGWPQQAG